MLFFDFIYLIFLTFCFFKPLYVYILSSVLSFLYIALLTPPNVYPYYGFCTCRSFSSHHHFSCDSKGRFVGCRKMLSIRRECIWRGLLPTRSSAQPQTSKFRLWPNSQNATTNGDLPLYVFFFISVSMCVCACMWRVEGGVLTSMCVFFLTSFHHLFVLFVRLFDIVCNSRKYCQHFLHPAHGPPSWTNI